MQTIARLLAILFLCHHDSENMTQTEDLCDFVINVNMVSYTATVMMIWLSLMWKIYVSKLHIHIFIIVEKKRDMRDRACASIL